jgi:hypothetical protein
MFCMPTGAVIEYWTQKLFCPALLVPQSASVEQYLEHAAPPMLHAPVSMPPSAPMHGFHSVVFVVEHGSPVTPAVLEQTDSELYGWHVVPEYE